MRSALDPRTSPGNASPPGDAAGNSPEDLLERFIRGEDRAFDRLVNLVGVRLFGFVLRFMGDHHLAEDVYQEIWIKVARHAHTYDRRNRFLTWLYRIARNACLDALRARARRPALRGGAAGEEGGMLDRFPARGNDSGEEAAARELGVIIARAVESLPEEQREVFLLKEDGDLTFEEIGQMLGCGKETAKSRMRYALKHLRGSLGREGRLWGLTEENP